MTTRQCVLLSFLEATFYVHPFRRHFSSTVLSSVVQVLLYTFFLLCLLCSTRLPGPNHAAAALSRSRQISGHYLTRRVLPTGSQLRQRRDRSNSYISLVFMRSLRVKVAYKTRFKRACAYKSWNYPCVRSAVRGHNATWVRLESGRSVVGVSLERFWELYALKGMPLLASKLFGGHYSFGMDFPCSRLVT